MQKQNIRKILHKPVLKDEVSELLRIGKYAHLNIQARLIDATVGFGGHAKEFIRVGWKVLGIDADKDALDHAEKVLRIACPTPVLHGGSFKLIHANFKDIGEIAKREGMREVEAILFDLGVSSSQLTSLERGFSFQKKETRLDMRLDRNSQGVTAADLVNALSKNQLVTLFTVVLPVRDAKRIAKETVAQRKIAKIETVGDFIEVVRRTIRVKKRLHPATLPFLALRIAVNSELDILEKTLPDAFKLLIKGGRLAVISFHSGEDGIVKKYFRKLAKENRGVIITKKPLTPVIGEIKKNAQARSAKLRVIEKI